MEFLVHIDVHLPPDFDEVRKQDLVRAEAERAKVLAAEGTIGRLWRIPGRRANVGIWRAQDATRLHDAISSLPLYAWLEVAATPLAAHPSDPARPEGPRHLNTGGADTCTASPERSCTGTHPGTAPASSF